MTNRPRDRQLSRHFQVGKDYAHAAHRKAGGESSLRPRIAGTLRYPPMREARDAAPSAHPGPTDV
jgi:hypothetical protein